MPNYISGRLAGGAFSSKMGYLTYWKTLSPGALNFWIQAFSVVAIFFEGYDQGVMGGVK